MKMKKDVIHKVRRSKIMSTMPWKLILVLISVLIIIGMTTGCTVRIVRNSGKADVPADGKTVTGAKQKGGSNTSDNDQPDGGTSTQEQSAGNEDAAGKGSGDVSANKKLSLSDEEVHKAYRRAVWAFGWFQYGSMPTDNEDAVEIDDYVYNRVTHDEIKTMADLKSYLQTIFADKIVEYLLDEDGYGIPQYRDINGALYTIPAGRGSDIFKGDETYEIIREGDKKIIYRVTVEIYDDPFEETVAGTEQYDFPLEYINGRWLFTDFELVR